MEITQHPVHIDTDGPSRGSIEPYCDAFKQYLGQSQVAQTAQVLVLKKAMDIQATGALALLQALPLATSGNLGTQVNTMA